MCPLETIELNAPGGIADLFPIWRFLSPGRKCRGNNCRKLHCWWVAYIPTKWDGARFDVTGGTDASRSADPPSPKDTVTRSKPDSRRLLWRKDSRCPQPLRTDPERMLGAEGFIEVEIE
jgi:hypothetical protein